MLKEWGAEIEGKVGGVGVLAGICEPLRAVKWNRDLVQVPAYKARFSAEKI